MPEPPPSRGSGLAVRAVVFILLFTVFWAGGSEARRQLEFAPIGIDDANIYFRYARNVIAGLGCVWNPDGERVEGFASPLWLGACTLGYLATPAPEEALFLVNAGLVALAAWIVALRLAQQIDPRGAGVIAVASAGIAVAAWTAASPGFVIWMTANAAAFCARRAYFGVWLPNTWYAKVDAELSYRLSKGFQYLREFAADHPVVCGAAAVSCAVSLFRARTPAVLLSIALVLFGVFNALFVGGDHFGNWRILQPYVLLVLVPAGAAIGSVARPVPAAAHLAAVVVGLSLLALHFDPTDWRKLEVTSHFYFRIPEYGRITGVAFNDIFPANERPVVGVIAAGGFPLMYAGKSFDLLALNDVEMAHASKLRRGRVHGHGAFHAPTFFRRAPELLIGFMLTVPANDPKPPEERIPFVTFDPGEERRFDELYAPVAISSRLPSTSGLVLPAWARRDWLERAGRRFGIRELVPGAKGWTYR